MLEQQRKNNEKEKKSDAEAKEAVKRQLAQDKTERLAAKNAGVPLTCFASYAVERWHVLLMNSHSRVKFDLLLTCFALYAVPSQYALVPGNYL